MEYQARRKIQAESTRRAILEAAGELTRQEGFDKLTIRQICQKAGVTTGAFYHHFSSKEELLTQGFSSLDVYLEQALEPHRNDPPLKRLELLLRSYAQYIQDMGWQTMSLYYNRRLSNPAAAFTMSPNRYTIYTMEDCVSQLQGEGLLAKSGSPRVIADFFFRHFRGTIIDWILHQGDYPLWPKLMQDYELLYTTFQT